MKEDFTALHENANALLRKGDELKSTSVIGINDPSELKNYLAERDVYIHEVSKYLTDMPAVYQKHFDGIEAALTQMKSYVKDAKTIDKELTKEQVAMAFAKASLFALHGPAAFTSEASRKELKTLIRAGTFKDDGSSREFILDKDAVATDLAPGGTNAGHTINPIYERTLLKYAAKKSIMSNFVRKLPMIAPQHSFPFLSARSILKTRTSAGTSGTNWSRSSKMANASTGPTFGDRVTILATTMATYIPWIDEFVTDIQINESLANLMMECWMEAYGLDFDSNVLVADSDSADWEYDGLLNVDGQKGMHITSPALEGMSPHELKTGSLKIQAEERDNLHYIMHETVLAGLMSKKNAVGDYLFWTPPSGDKPAKLGGYPYIESSVMPQADTLKPGDTFMALIDPQNLWVGEREGMEVRQFDATIYALEYQQNFTRYRIRNGFKVTKPAASCLFKLAKG